MKVRVNGLPANRNYLGFTFRSDEFGTRVLFKIICFFVCIDFERGQRFTNPIEYIKQVKI